MYRDRFDFKQQNEDFLKKKRIYTNKIPINSFPSYLKKR